MAPFAPPRFQAPIENPGEAFEEADAPDHVELVARAQRPRPRRRVTQTGTRPDTPIGVQRTRTENP